MTHGLSISRACGVNACKFDRIVLRCLAPLPRISISMDSISRAVREFPLPGIIPEPRCQLFRNSFVPGFCHVRTKKKTNKHTCKHLSFLLFPFSRFLAPIIDNLHCTKNPYSHGRKTASIGNCGTSFPRGCLHACSGLENTRAYSSGAIISSERWERSN